MDYPNLAAKLNFDGPTAPTDLLRVLSRDFLRVLGGQGSLSHAKRAALLSGTKLRQHAVGTLFLVNAVKGYLLQAAQTIKVAQSYLTPKETTP